MIHTKRYALTTLLFCLAASFCAGQRTLFIPKAPDYHDDTMWVKADGDPAETGADVFYVVSTWEEDWTAADGSVSHYADVWNEKHREHMATEMRRVAVYMSPGNRFYAPFYRHITIDGWVEQNADTIRQRTRLAMADVCAAFDLFQAQRDTSRPLIIAGFSQGGMAVVELLKHMDDATYSQLAAAYVLGYKVTPEDTLQTRHIKAAQGERDTGVTICYNTVKDVRYAIPLIASSCMAINPVNWRTDATPAMLHDSITVTLSPEYHVLVVSGYSGAEYKPYRNFINVGDIHSCEPWLYSECLQKNIGVRAREWRASRNLTDMACPRAEWAKAGVILMHTPGQELFNGVIHPSAGLFEDYFDVDKAAREHENYMEMLRRQGIRVLRVADILQEVGLDSLRELAARVLTYDISGIADEDAAATERYRQEVLSKMSRADLIRCILLQPTVKLSKTDSNTGYEAQYQQNPLMNLYFTRDQSISTPRGHVICRMNSSQRAPETDIISLCYEHLGISPILRIQGEGRLEGGDYIPAGNVSFIGCGMRTNDEGIRQLMEADAFGHDTVVVVRDHKLWQMQMHLDTYFNVIDRDLCTMVTSRLNAQPDTPEYGTCDIWTRKPGTQTYKLWKRNKPFVDYLHERGFSIIPIGHDDEMHYANNFLTIAPRHIMAVGGQSEALQQRFSKAGVRVEWIPLESLIDGYGAAHCMTQVLRREK
ncbi:MAG: DUF3089 domain-containing protein [Prevotella sp.]|nr:DUF3089 domain-containing protein [Prevotella sp.]